MTRYEDHVDRRRKEMVGRLKKLGSNPGLKRFKEWQEKKLEGSKT